MRTGGCREAACRQRADMTAELDPSLPDIMKPSEALAAHRVEIRDIVLSHRVINPRVFGSVARGLDTIDSDLDILVDTTPETTLFDLGAIRYKLHMLQVRKPTVEVESISEYLARMAARRHGVNYRARARFGKGIKPLMIRIANHI